MLEESTLTFLKNLKTNNTKEWFENNKNTYESAKANYIAITTEILKGISAIDKTLAHLEPKKCIFRINRDIRFSKDKSPYKTNFGMSFSKGGKSVMRAGYYFHLEPQQCFIGGGIYMPMPNDVKKIRQKIDYNFNTFSKIIQNKKFLETFGSIDFNKQFSLQRAPKGYEETNPAIQYLKLKTWIVSNNISDKEALDKNLVDNVVTSFSTMQPFINFLNDAIEG